jgi:hypothetical protein
MNNKLIALLLLVSSNAIGQISFESGYFINNNNQRIECLINNNDWKNNPKEFEYKLSISSIPQIADITSIKEFGINSYSKFVRVKTSIDRSSTNISSLSDQSGPEWSEELLFLKVLVEGKATLYSFVDGDISLYFYSLSDSIVNQLIYKLYFAVDSSSNSVKTVCFNNKFRQQLWIDMKCPGQAMSSVENLQYNNKMLKHYFIKFNNCYNDSVVEYNKKKYAFSVKITPGINYSKMSMTNFANPYRDTDFGNKACFRIGLEAEYILPFNKDKWGILFEPTFQSFSSTSKNSYGNTEMKYRSIEFPVGVRYYIFLSNAMKLFINGSYIPAFSPDFHSTFNSGNSYSAMVEINSRASFAFGGGIAFSKLSAEFRYYTKRDLLRDYVSWNTDYQRFSIILGFRIFKIA